MADRLEVLVADGKDSGGGVYGSVTGSTPGAGGDGDGEPRGSGGGTSSSDGTSAGGVGGDGGSSGDASDGNRREYGGGTNVNGTNVSHGGGASRDPAQLREERCWNGVVVTSLGTRGDVSLTALGKFPTAVANLGEGLAWDGYKTKALAWADFVFSDKVDDDDILIYADGDDVSFGGCSCDYLMGVYWSIVNRSGRTIVFGAEVVCGEQDCRLVPQVPDWAPSVARRSDLGTGYWGRYLDTTKCSEEPWDDKCIDRQSCAGGPGVPLSRCRDPQMQVASKYLNSGFVMGPVRDLKPMLQWVLQHYDDVSWWGGDQSVVAAWWLRNQDKATLDYTGQIILTLNHLMVTKALTIPEDAPAGNIWNEVAGATACFYHYNGLSFPLGRAFTIKAVSSVKQIEAAMMEPTVSDHDEAVLGSGAWRFLDVCYHAQPLAFGAIWTTASVGALVCVVTYLVTLREIYAMRPCIQRVYYMRILRLPLIFALSAWLAILNPSLQMFATALQKAYGAFALASFGLLFLMFLSIQSHEVKEPVAGAPLSMVERISLTLRQEGPVRHFAAPPLCCIGFFFSPHYMSVEQLGKVMLMLRQYVVVVPGLSMANILVAATFSTEAYELSQRIFLYVSQTSAILCIWSLSIMHRSSHTTLQGCHMTGKFLAIKGFFILSIVQDYVVDGLMVAAIRNSPSCFQDVGFREEWAMVQARFISSCLMVLESILFAIVLKRNFPASEVDTHCDVDFHHDLLALEAGR